MIGFFELLPKHPDISPEGFHDQWRHPHGTASRQFPWITRYVQHHRVDTTFLGVEQREFEGCGEVAWDTVHDMVATVTDPTHQRFADSDDREFAVRPGPRIYVGAPEILVSGTHDRSISRPSYTIWDHRHAPNAIKILQFIYREADPDWASDDDLPLGRCVGALRHVRHHPLRESPHGWHGAGDTILGGRPLKELLKPDNSPFIGIRELVWPTVSAFNAGVESDNAAWNRLIGRKGKTHTMLARAEVFI